MNLNLSITNGVVSSKIYDKRDDFDFEIASFPFLVGDVSRSPSYVYIFLSLFVEQDCVLEGAKIRNRYNQAPHLTQYTT